MLINMSNQADANPPAIEQFVHLNGGAERRSPGLDKIQAPANDAKRAVSVVNQHLVFCDYDLTPQKTSSVRFAIPQDQEVHAHSEPVDRAPNEQVFAAHQQISPRSILSPRSMLSPRGMVVQQHTLSMPANGMPAMPRNVVIIQSSAQQQMMSPRRPEAHAAQMHRVQIQGTNGWQEMLSPRMAGGPVNVMQANVPQNRDLNRVMSQSGSASPRCVSLALPANSLLS
jgi:hypothetical protein